ncbi:unnamed protein product, partial [Linum tenue]
MRGFVNSGDVIDRRRRGGGGGGGGGGRVWRGCGRGRDRSYGSDSFRRRRRPAHRRMEAATAAGESGMREILDLERKC